MWIRNPDGQYINLEKADVLHTEVTGIGTDFCVMADIGDDSVILAISGSEEEARQHADPVCSGKRHRMDAPPVCAAQNKSGINSPQSLHRQETSAILSVH